MTTPNTHRYFCIHGHFYQPPRENPLIEQVELQPSAGRSHDWNERIFVECYGPNGASRILDDKGRIKEIINNYAYMSFNIGPTLFSWLEEKHPYIYSKIIEADKESSERLDGHGNAMAQVYNHVIMPLATEEQRRLQIEWGMVDFERRFGRKPEGMWLAETAINMDTVVSLIRAGIKYTVLAPTQAMQIRHLYDNEWIDVSNNTIDSRRPYRIFPVAEDGTPIEKGYLDVFFYDGGISHGVGFDHLLTDAGKFGNRISQAFDAHINEDQFVTVCTDGESYGHHEAFGDMCAAYLFHAGAEALNMAPVNYAWYLAKHPPQFEARIKNAHGEGTAWSCAHGVGRWKNDCGCSNGGEDGWNQQWRRPFRDALDLLYSAAEKLTETKGPVYFKNWQQAKDSAILSWQFDSKQRLTWWDKHLIPGADVSAAADIMEILRFSHYIFTSCAWFFADISGIETLQNLKYALRIIQLLEIRGVTSALRVDFLAELSKAKSNVGEKTGDQIFLELENELLPTLAYLALGQWVKSFTGESFAYAESPLWKHQNHIQKSFGLWTIHESNFKHTITSQSKTTWLIFHQDGFDADVMGYSEDPSTPLSDWKPTGDSHAETPSAWLAPLPVYTITTELLPLDIKGKMAIHLKNLFWEESASEVRMQEWRLGVIDKQFQKLGWPLPQSILQTLSVIENFRLVEILLSGLRKNDFDIMKKAFSIAVQLRSQGVVAHLGPAKRKLHNYLIEWSSEFIHSPEKIDLRPFYLLLDLIDLLKLNLERYRIENLAFPILKSLKAWEKTGEMTVKIDPADAILLLDRLNFNTETAKSHLVAKKAAS